MNTCIFFSNYHKVLKGKIWGILSLHIATQQHHWWSPHQMFIRTQFVGIYLLYIVNLMAITRYSGIRNVKYIPPNRKTTFLKHRQTHETLKIFHYTLHWCNVIDQEIRQNEIYINQRIISHEQTPDTYSWCYTCIPLRKNCELYN